MLRSSFPHEAVRRCPKLGVALRAVLLCCLASLSCRKPPENRLVIAFQVPPEARAKLMACAQLTDVEPKAGAKLKVINATNTAESTEVRVRVSAPNHPVEFHFPAYSLSRGRWLINEQGRAYLIDQSCRQFKLKDRRAVDTRIPPDGRVSLRAGEQMEGVLVFPRLFDETQVALLVYGDERLLVLILPLDRLTN